MSIDTKLFIKRNAMKNLKLEVSDYPFFNLQFLFINRITPQKH